MIKAYHVLIGLVLIFVFIATLVALSQNPMTGDLTVYVECEGEPKGSLSISHAQPTNSTSDEQIFDVESSCEIFEVIYESYVFGSDIAFNFTNSNGTSTRLVTQYGTYLGADRLGYYVILQISNTSPYLANRNM